MKWSILLILLTLYLGVSAQRLDVPELFGMLDLSHFRIDTTLKKKGYLLMQKDVDSVSSIYQYSHVDRQENKPTMIRSLMYMDVKADGTDSRLVNYRTYSEEEFTAIARWLLDNNYQSKSKTDSGNTKNTVYTSGKETVLVRVTTTKIDKSKVFTSWEIELGK